jgi:hypothetical protein
MPYAEIVVVDSAGWTFGLRSTERIDFFIRPEMDLSVDTVDAAVVASVLYWMSRGRPRVHVRGAVSATLLANMEELQCCWAKWRPNEYKRFEIVPDEIMDDRPVGSGAIAAFSGGVDAAFTLLTKSRPSPNSAMIVQDVAMVHGFDIGLEEPDVFARALTRAKAMTKAHGMPVRVVRTDIKHKIPTYWEDFCGLAVASTLLTFQSRRQTGLIGSSNPYDRLWFPHGSTPVQEWMASTGRMQIRHDGSGFNRIEKVDRIGDVVTVTKNLRVCWSGMQHDRNCGRCEKCVRTILNFRAAGRPVPTCFPNDVDKRLLRSLRPSHLELTEYDTIISEAIARGIRAPWLRVIKRMMKRRRFVLRLRDTALGAVYRTGRRVVRRFLH